MFVDSLKEEIKIWEKMALDNAKTNGVLEYKLEQILSLAIKNNYDDIIKIIES